MNYDELPIGNGQEIYVDIDMLYIKPDFFNRDLHAIILPDITNEETNPVYETYKKLFNILYQKGYKIIIDSKLASERTFFFTPCFDKHINNTKKDYKTKKDQKIKNCLSEFGIYEPFSVNFLPNGFPSNLPELPFVLKNESSQGGEEKFIIKTPEQLETLRRFYNEINTYDFKQKEKRLRKVWGEDLIFDESGCSNKGICINLIDYKKVFYENMRIQKFVNTPTRFNTSLRVIFTASGDVLASSLKYAETSTKINEKYYGLFDRYLSSPKSPYFIGSESIVSNTVAGGNSILLGKDYYKEEEKKILLSHEIDPNCAIVPDDISKAIVNVGLNCAREIGAICGMDFIYDTCEHRWKYLEEHEQPMLYSYCEKYNIPYNPNSESFYLENQLIDIDARLKSLVLFMNKKYNMVRNRSL